ncbi:hypothetical protein OSB04_018135 [Centaurea solstitialis]|uniref:DUF4220 domain-containing protein n=1 Tax=Centaurea solstitialis TaxID=347529 RepID=A0AA38WJ14_9ASTR|nr:hypothetical protein OSB04_018135 [Centaurea solstitialis]
MFWTVLSSLIFVDQKRRLFQILEGSVRKQWNIWEPRGLVLISLALQVLLIYSGNKRKYIANRWIRAFIWSAYLLADWVATLALGILVNRSSSHVGNCHGDQYGNLRLMAFWAPFLLLHLGGPDTITAYALADNELWLRHFLGLLVQTAAAIYITFLSWDGTTLSYLTIPMLLCGIVKYGERTWVLRSADRKNLQDSFLGARPTAGVNFVRFMEEFKLREAEGYLVTAASMEEGRSPRDYLTNTTDTSQFNHFRDELLKANYFFNALQFKQLLVDLVLSFHQRDESRDFFKTYSPAIAFGVIECELGFAYDVFYTKAPIIYTRFGLFFRIFTFFTTLSVFVAFFASIDVRRSHKYPLVDVVITCILLIGAILLESYAAICALSSDWAILWFSQHSSKFSKVCSLVLSGQSENQRRWSCSVYQYNLLRFCHAHQKYSGFYKILSFIPLGEMLKNLWVKHWVSFNHQKPRAVPIFLKDVISKHLHEKSMDTELDRKILLARPWEVALKTQGKYEDLKWSVEVEFDHIILIWHIATDIICYKREKSKREKNKLKGRSEELDVHKEEWEVHMEYSKQLADYMLYLLVECPFMLPIGIGMVRFQDTCIQALALLEEKRSWKDKYTDLYVMLGQAGTKSFPGTLKVDDMSESVLFEACNLAARLEDMDDPRRRWKMVLDVWIGILGYAAGQCNGFDHAKQLHKGGELLTHVWLLMAHLGLTEHFKEQSHGRAKVRTT